MRVDLLSENKLCVVENPSCVDVSKPDKKSGARHALNKTMQGCKDLWFGMCKHLSIDRIQLRTECILRGKDLSTFYFIIRILGCAFDFVLFGWLYKTWIKGTTKTLSSFNRTLADLTIPKTLSQSTSNSLKSLITTLLKILKASMKWERKQHQ